MAHTILFVEDEPDVRSVTVFRLKKAGYEVTLAVDGQQALDSIYASAPDLVLLDLRLPIFTGIEVCQRIKADEKLKHIPVILFTASTDNLKENVAEAKADDFMTKPFDPVVLMEKIRSHLKE